MTCRHAGDPLRPWVFSQGDFESLIMPVRVI